MDLANDDLYQCQKFPDLVLHMYYARPKIQPPSSLKPGGSSFRHWQNIDILIQLINIGAVLESQEAPLTEIFGEMKKEEALAALRQLRDKVRSDPEYFSDS